VLKLVILYHPQRPKEELPSDMETNMILQKPHQKTHLQITIILNRCLLEIKRSLKENHSDLVDRLWHQLDKEL